MFAISTRLTYVSEQRIVRPLRRVGFYGEQINPGLWGSLSLQERYFGRFVYGEATVTARY